MTAQIDNIPIPSAAERRQRRMVGTGLILASALAFSFLPIFNRYAADAGVNVTTLLALRFSIAALVVWAILARAGRLGGAARLSKRRVVGLFCLGAIYVAQSSSFFVASRRIPVAMTIILLYLYPVVVTLLAWLFLKDRLTGWKIVSLVMALVGSLLILGAPEAASDLLGIGLGLLSALLYSTYIVLGSRLQIGVPVRLAAALIMSAAAAIFLLFGLASGQLNLALSIDGLLAVLGLALVSTVLSFLTFFAGMERIGPARASIVSTVEPLGSVILAALLLGETLAPLQLFGGAMILTAVVLLAVRREQEH